MGFCFQNNLIFLFFQSCLTTSPRQTGLTVSCCRVCPIFSALLMQTFFVCFCPCLISSTHPKVTVRPVVPTSLCSISKLDLIGIQTRRFDSEKCGVSPLMKALLHKNPISLNYSKATSESFRKKFTLSASVSLTLASTGVCSWF